MRLIQVNLSFAHPAGAGRQQRQRLSGPDPDRQPDASMAIREAAAMAPGLTRVKAGAAAWWSPTDPAFMQCGGEGAAMVDGLEWQGFASMVESGVREALYVAGVDCAMPGRTEPEHDSASFLESGGHDSWSP